MSQYDAYEGANALASTMVAISGAFVIIWLIALVLSIVVLIANIKIYKKLGLPGWGVIVPIYGQWILLKAVELPGWLSILPVANIIALIVANYRLAGKFGKGAGFGLGLVFLTPIFYMILGFGKVSVNNGNDNSNVGFDLMSQDPNEGGELNLMTPDPIANIPVEEPVVKGNELNEAPGLEEQITAEPAPQNIIVSEPEVLDVPAASESNSNVDNIFGTEEKSAEPVYNNQASYENIFEMPAFKSDVPSEPEKKPEEIFNGPEFENTISIEKISNPEMPTGEIELPKVSSDAIAEEIMSGNSKVCPNCGYSNNSSVKACIKCGHLLD